LPEHEMHVCAEAVEDASKFNCYVATSNHCDFAASDENCMATQSSFAEVKAIEDMLARQMQV